MPDWSYRTLFRPVLFALPPRLARDLTIGVMGTLARTPLGPHVIDFLGHMRPSPKLARTVLGRRFAGPLGIAAELDPGGYALPALARFGVGFVVVGPCVGETSGDRTVSRNDASQSLDFGSNYTDVAVDRALGRLVALPKTAPAMVRVHADDAGLLPKLLADAKARRATIAALAVEPRDDHLEGLSQIAQTMGSQLPLLLCMRADDDAERIARILRAARHSGLRVEGVLISGTVSHGSHLQLGTPARAAALDIVSRLRAGFASEELAIIAGGGLHEPRHALELLSAGADLALIDSGLVFSGPGLIKRTNEAILAEQVASQTLEQEATASPARYAWFWIWLMGLAMFFGGVLALGIAGTRVVLPYDEHFVGLTRAELDAINPRLLAFMTHDRVTLAGTMLAVGILYSGLGWHAVRRGYHWAWVAVLASAMTGFFSFFTFLGFGYFEPFHAFVTTLLFQLLLLAWHAPLGAARLPSRVPLEEDWRWRLAQWGQLLLVIEALAVLTAGIVITIVGSTSVFVQEDLAFMQCSADLIGANPRLLGLIAHDRATFGGMLMASGLTTLMATLWGFSAGRGWLWSTLFFAGSVGYLCTLFVHYAVGYVDLHHLLPAYIGLALHWLGLALAGPYLLWQEYREV